MERRLCKYDFNDSFSFLLFVTFSSAAVYSRVNIFHVFLPYFHFFTHALQCSTLCNKKKRVMLANNDTTSNITGEKLWYNVHRHCVWTFTQNSTVHTHVRVHLILVGSSMILVVLFSFWFVIYFFQLCCVFV